MQFKSALAIFALCSVVVKAAPINWESVDLVERDYDNELEARFSDLLLEELESREWDDELEVRSERGSPVKQLYKHSLPLEEPLHPVASTLKKW